MKKPNFIIGGTAAGGTSFLAAVMVQHPQIYLPIEMRPEPHYFYKSWEYEKGHAYYLSRWFSNVPNEAIAIGERSSSYLFGGEEIAKRIAFDYPDMKFLFTLRNPIERTWANYRYTVLQGLEPLSFEDALMNEEKRISDQKGVWSEIQPHNYTGRGFYAKQISGFLKYFPISNLLFIKSELLSKETNIELKKIYEFLNLTLTDFEYERPSDHTSVNVIDPELQMDLRHYFEERFDKIIEALRKGESVDRFARSNVDSRRINELVTNIVGEKQTMPAKCRSYLTSLFASDIEKLREYLNFDVSDWQ
ncbi:MAG: sulfotransferase [Gammaproteobacteria bacterium]